MRKKLEKYLDEVRDYLVTDEDAADVLKEIESNILEKCQAQYGECSDENIEKTLATFGKAIDVAKEYSSGEPLIPVFLKKVLWFYTGVLFLVHLGLNGLAFGLHSDGFIFPFFFNGVSGWASYLVSIPLLLVFDFGLVCLLLAGVSQLKASVLLPLPRRSFLRPKGERKYNVWIQVLLLVMSGFFLSLAFDPQTFENLVKSAFSGTDMHFVALSDLFTGLYIGVAINVIVETLFYFVGRWFRTGFLEFLKAVVSISVWQYVLRTAVPGLEGLELLVQNVLKGVLIFVVVILVINVIVMLVRSVVREVKEHV